MSEFYVGLICETRCPSHGIAWAECEIKEPSKAAATNGLVCDWLIDVPALGRSPDIDGLWAGFEKWMRKLPDKDQQIKIGDLADLWIPKELVEVLA